MPNLSLNPDTSSTALARRPLAAGWLGFVRALFLSPGTVLLCMRSAHSKSESKGTS